MSGVRGHDPNCPGEQQISAVRVAQPARPPKLNRPPPAVDASSSGAPAPPVVEDDDITIRVRLDSVEDVVPVPAPPPLPNTSSSREQPPLVAVEVPASPDAVRLPGARYTKIGVAIFAAGVLVGVVVSAALMSSRSVQVADAAAPSASTPKAAKPAALAMDAPKPAPPTPPKAQALARTEERRNPAADEKKIQALGNAEPHAREPITVPVSSSSAPSCQELLGGKVVERDAPKAALRETRLANRELLLGNVREAQRAYCTAFAWDRSNIDRHVNLGRFFLFRRDWEKAQEYGLSALELDPKDRRALGVVGDAWAALDRTTEARAAWLAAEKKTKASRRELGLMARRDLALAKRVERLKDFSLAERLYRRVLLLDPRNAGAMKGIASCLLKVGDYEGAAAWARRADMLKRDK